MMRLEEAFEGAARPPSPTYRSDSDSSEAGDLARGRSPTPVYSSDESDGASEDGSEGDAAASTPDTTSDESGDSDDEGEDPDWFPGLPVPSPPGLDSDDEEEDPDWVPGAAGPPVPSGSDSTEEERMGTEPADAERGGWTSREGTLWRPTAEGTIPHQPWPAALTPGVTRYAAARVDSILSTFELFITVAMVENIVHCTNLRASRMVVEVDRWQPVDRITIKAYIGLMLLAGVYRSHHESNRSLWSSKSGRSIFPATMSRKRWEEVSRMLR